MDFTDAFRITRTGSQHIAAYSPGSAFLATIHHIPSASGEKTKHAKSLLLTLSSSSDGRLSQDTQAVSTLVQIRASSTLQIVRTWTLPFAVTTLRWSDDGTMVLLSAKDRFAVFGIDNRSTVKRTRTLEDNCILAVSAGAEGMYEKNGTTWIGDGAICCFSADSLLATIYDVRHGSTTILPMVKVPRAFPSPSRRLVAFLIRTDGLDSIAIYALHNGKVRLISTFPTRTNDAVGVCWSPDERFLAVWDGILEYKLQIVSLLGHLQSTFLIEEVDPVTLLSSPLAVGSSTFAAGGIGIRDVRWSADGQFISIGDYVDRIRVLETREWSECATFDVGTMSTERSIVEQSTLTAWREPIDWQAKTGGRSIVVFEAMQLPVSLPKLQGELSKSNPKTGICWMEWNVYGDLLAVRCESVPNALFVFAVTSVDDDANEPRLTSIVVFSSTISHAIWRPNVDGEECALAVACRSQALFIWRHRRGEQITHIVEAIPIPIQGFSALSCTFNPDGRTLLLLSDSDTFCCAVDADRNEHVCEDEVDMSLSRL